MEPLGRSQHGVEDLRGPVAAEADSLAVLCPQSQPLGEPERGHNRWYAVIYRGNAP